MKNLHTLFSIVLLLATATISSCQQKNNTDKTTTGTTTINDKIDVSEFEALISSKPEAQLIDVRTPEEYNEGHLANALNIDYNGDNFEAEINKLDKNKPVLVYCKSGGRSSSAASKMGELGFVEVHNLAGGIMKWSAANMPVTTSVNSAKNAGISLEDFQKQVTSDKYVLVDFNAKWCAPCQKMMPTLEKIAAEKKDKIELQKIDVDANQMLVNAKKIDGIPYLELYKNGKLIWSHQGYLDEATFLAETKL